MVGARSVLGSHAQHLAWSLHGGKGGFGTADLLQSPAMPGAPEGLHKALIVLSLPANVAGDESAVVFTHLPCASLLWVSK